MKRIFSRFVILISLVLSFVKPSIAIADDYSPITVNLIAGQNKLAGDVKVWDDGTSLFVLYEAFTPWCLTETHLTVTTSLDDIPQANGNPIPGQFPYKNTHKCATNYLYKIPLNHNVCDLYIAAHAVVKSPGSTETAWGDGRDFSGNNWGTYFTYTVSSCTHPTPTESPTPSPTEPVPTTPPVTDTPTMTPTDTSTPTDTPTLTPTDTLTLTPTDTLTLTPTDTPTLTPTDTPTLTPTDTPTLTPTDTPTLTPSPTSTPVCQPTIVIADFSKVATGQSVEGMGVVAPNLNIDAKGTAVKITEGFDPTGYGAPNASPIKNYGITAGGFTDMDARLALQAHLYTFTFASGVSASHFSLHMQDYGDWNPTASTDHHVSATAYNANGFIVSRQEINYTTPAVTAPTSSSVFGNVSLTGDAATALPGELGDWTWDLYGTGIVKVVLEFGDGYDPAFGLDVLTYTTDCGISTP